MAPGKRQPRRILGLAAVLFWLLLVQNAFGFPFRQTSSSLRGSTPIRLSPRNRLRFSSVTIHSESLDHRSQRT